MAALGARVRMLVRGGGLLAGHEPFAGQHVTEALERAGVRVDLRAEVTDRSRKRAADTGLGRIHGGEITIRTNSPDGASMFEADEILVATGRQPRLDGLGLESLGLTSEDIAAGRLPDWLCAVGDASVEAPLTHWGQYRARVLGAQIRARALGEEAEEIQEYVPAPRSSTAIRSRLGGTD
ncbi:MULTISPECIES: FAD-dependent oxidoreductase [unclassified Brevibacterium]|uniref:FAD-dependent oxidoreductase n=1 Tax=unclassified Brevibacterium TaxID=2614124 RepID=UPI000C442091|nr:MULTISPECIES: FAD-dependent oxidoreductase [unclassified Brevibacterium]SMX96360.1 Pyridine nucleotide-disulphide oxidoreductase [Brevibacterium sp. 239c]